MMMSSKYKNHYFWSDDEFGYSKKIEKRFLEEIINLKK